MRTISVFCGRYYGNDQPRFQKHAISIGTLLAKNGYRVATGGGIGQMKDVSKAAFDAGGHVIAIQLDKPGWVPGGIYTEMEKYPKIKDRQEKLISLADGMIILPGGVGTLYETFEVISRKILKELSSNLPIVFIDSDYYGPIRKFLENGCNTGFIPEKLIDICSFVSSAEEAVEVLNKAFK